MKKHRAKIQVKANNPSLPKKFDKKYLCKYTTYIKISRFFNRKKTKNSVKLFSQDLIFSIFKV